MATLSHAFAAEGTTVVLTVTPDKGYVLDKLTVLDSKDNEIGTDKNAGKYSFKMPGGKVSVKAAFKKGEEAPDGDAAGNKAKFTDVKDSDYFAKAVAWAVEKGITTGTAPATFSPSITILHSLLYPTVFLSNPMAFAMGQRKHRVPRSRSGKVHANCTGTTLACTLIRKTKKESLPIRSSLFSFTTGAEKQPVAPTSGCRSCPASSR